MGCRVYRWESAGAQVEGAVAEMKHEHAAARILIARHALAQRALSRGLLRAWHLWRTGASSSVRRRDGLARAVARFRRQRVVAALQAWRYWMAGRQQEMATAGLVARR